MDFSKLSQSLSNKLKNVLNIRLSTVLVTLLSQHVSDSMTLLVFLSVTLVFFNHLQWNLFEGLLLTMIVNLLINIFQPFEQSNSDVLVLYNLSIFFILLQVCMKYIPVSMRGIILGRTQWIYSTTVLKVVQRYINNEIIGVMVLFSLVFVLKFSENQNKEFIQNKEFVGLYTMAAISGFQNLVLRDIPVIFLVPTSVILVYFMHGAVKILEKQTSKGIASDIGSLSDFIVYTVADEVQQQIRKEYNADVVLYLSIVCMVFFRVIQLQHGEYILQLMIVIVGVDIIMSYLVIVYQSDPVLSLVILSFSFKILMELFSKNY